jgi:uncharacterized protein (TIGR00299 family) protein
MKIGYLDTVGGIAGDMTMAACVSAGVAIDELSAELKKLGIGGFALEARHISRNAIDAVHIEVVVTPDAPRYHRHLRDILAIIDGSTLSARVKEQSRAIFTVVAEAEATLHGSRVDRVHFHEVGALDSLVDIVGSAVCFERLDIERVYSSPVRLGNGGLVQTQHGLMPTPTPATLQILRGYPTILTSVPDELTTPTGAAIVKALSYGVLTDEQIEVSAVGYGAGTKEIAGLPNFLRLVVGELHVNAEGDEVVVVETNIDDMNPQVYPWLIDRLLAAGAHDVYCVPIVMKKGRPGILLSVMAPIALKEAVIATIYRETSTIGVRVQNIGRRKLPRRLTEVNTTFGPVKAKMVLRDGVEVLTPEYEECKRIALATGRPLLDVMRTMENEISPKRGMS